RRAQVAPRSPLRRGRGRDGGHRLHREDPLAAGPTPAGPAPRYAGRPSRGSLMAAQELKPRRLPVRTCIGCRQEAGKREVVRLVRTPEGRVAIDPTGRANGRGAYLHATRPCWEKALKGGTMHYALKVAPAPEDIEALRAYASGLPPEESELS